MKPFNFATIVTVSVKISNLFREALGLPLIKSGNYRGLGDGKVRILPFIGTPSIFAPVNGKDADGAIKFISIETLMMITTMDTMPTAVTTKVSRGTLIIVYLDLYSYC